MSTPPRASLFGADDKRSAAGRMAGLMRQALALLRLPPPAIAFYLRALRLGRGSDTVSVAIAARPRELTELIHAARKAVAEVGTGTGWTAIVLALARPDRRVHSVDVSPHRQRAGRDVLLAQAGEHLLDVAARQAGRAFACNAFA